MIRETDVQTLLQNEAQLTALFTGGIITFSGDLQGWGLTKRTYPNAWEAPDRLLMKPTLVVRIFRLQATFDIRSTKTQERSGRTVVRLQYYDDASHGWTALYQAQAIVTRALEGKPAGGWHLEWQDNDDTVRVRELDNACSIVETYYARGIHRPS